ncbi:hypothetical protein M1432_00055 [Patescibacteria group bacterium]|nr:hypothetical protein [Patescibacteria group bacterium]
MIAYNTLMALTKGYLDEMKRRAKESRVYRKYQLTGLMLSEILGDRPHKALYIKLAKERDEQELLTLAESIASNKNVKNKGAYFMRLLFDGGKAKNK